MRLICILLLCLTVSASASEFWGTTNQVGGTGANMENIWQGSRHFCPVSGTLDSIGFYLNITGATTTNAKVAIFDATGNFIDSSLIRGLTAPGDTVWFWFDMVGNATVTAGNFYWIYVWGNNTANAASAIYYNNVSTAAPWGPEGDSAAAKASTYGVWPSTMGAVTKTATRTVVLQVAVTPSGYYKMGNGYYWKAEDTYIEGGADSTTHNNTAMVLYSSCYNGPSWSGAATLSEFSVLNRFISGKTIDSAKFHHVVSGVEADGASDTVFAVVRILRDWISAEVDWNEYATGSNWGTAAMRGAGTDFATTDSFHVDWGPSGYGAADTITIRIDDFVQVWANDTTDNFGLGLIAYSGDDFTVLATYAADVNEWYRRPFIEVWVHQEEEAVTGQVIIIE